MITEYNFKKKEEKKLRNPSSSKNMPYDFGFQLVRIEFWHQFIELQSYRTECNNHRCHQINLGIKSYFQYWTASTLI